VKFGSLFTGIGGLDLGFEWAGAECAWQVEKDEFCQNVLAQRWPDIPRYGDIRNVGKQNLTRVDAVIGGFPCQPFSVAGQQRGTEDDRHLWPEMFRVIRELRPRWVIGENVPGIISVFIDEAIADLESEGYTCELFVLPALSVDAYHRRDRLFLVGYSQHDGRITSEEFASLIEGSHSYTSWAIPTGEPARPGIQWPTVANPYRSRSGGRNGTGSEGQRPEVLQGQRKGGSMGRETSGRRGALAKAVERGRKNSWLTSAVDWSIAHADLLAVQRNWPDGIEVSGEEIEKRTSGRQYTRSGRGDWQAEPRLGGMAHGISTWLDEPDIPRLVEVDDKKLWENRVKAIGNAVVPQLAEHIARVVLAADHMLNYANFRHEEGRYKGVRIVNPD
jgi:site-specific DNA-cytosine methylase